jgi:integrase
MGYPCVTLALSEWPTGDRALWSEATSADDPLSEAGRASHWSARTRRQVEKDYGRFLFWLQSNGEVDDAATPGQRLTKDRLRAYHAHLQATGMASTSLLSRFRALSQAFAALDPNANLSLLRLLCARLRARAVPRREKHLRLVDPAELVHMALAYFDHLVSGEGPIPIRRCNHARDAAMLAFLAFIPLRLGSFASLAIGKSLISTPTGMRVNLLASDTKEKRPYDCPCPEDLWPYLDHYQRAIRPRLLGQGDTDALWVSMRGTALSASAIHYQMIKITRRLFGHPINPHLVRDCVLTSLAIGAPKNVRAGARLLGHQDLRTGETHYNHATAASAGRQHFKVINDLRRRHSEGNGEDDT